MGYPFPRELMAGLPEFWPARRRMQKIGALRPLPQRTYGPAIGFFEEPTSNPSAARVVQVSEGHPSLQWREGVANMAQRGGKRHRRFLR
jgi:hypothetical protein